MVASRNRASVDADGRTLETSAQSITAQQRQQRALADPVPMNSKVSRSSNRRSFEPSRVESRSSAAMGRQQEQLVAASRDPTNSFDRTSSSRSHNKWNHSVSSASPRNNPTQPRGWGRTKTTSSRPVGGATNPDTVDFMEVIDLTEEEEAAAAARVKLQVQRERIAAENSKAAKASASKKTKITVKSSKEPSQANSSSTNSKVAPKPEIVAPERRTPRASGTQEKVTSPSASLSSHLSGGEKQGVAAGTVSDTPKQTSAASSSPKREPTPQEASAWNWFLPEILPHHILPNKASETAVSTNTDCRDVVNNAAAAVATSEAGEVRAGPAAVSNEEKSYATGAGAASNIVNNKTPWTGLLSWLDPEHSVQNMWNNSSTKSPGQETLLTARNPNTPTVNQPDDDASNPPLDDSSTAASSKLFGDLNSLPSVKEDDHAYGGTGDPQIEAHLDVRDDRSGSVTHENVAAIVEKKVNEINIPKAMPKSLTDEMEELDNVARLCRLKGGGQDTTIEARRQLLVRELRSAMSTFGRYDIRCANISAALGDLLQESNESGQQAIKLHKDAVMVYSAKLGDDHTTTLAAKVRLGNVLEEAGEYDEAINTYFLVTVMRRALKGEQDPSAAEGLVSMAHALRKKGDYIQAIKELKRALKIYREALGDAHEKVSSTVDEIASLYVTIGDFEKSAAILEEVVKLKAATLGMKSKPVAVTLISLATTYECSEQFSKAMKSLKKGYKIYTETEGYSSEAATATLNRIAQLYEATEDHNRASIAYLGVLRGRKIILGNDHLLVGETYYKLGVALRQTGQLEKALKCQKEALPIYVGKGVEMHDVEMIAEVMHEMALINKEKHHYHESARILRQELSVRRKIGQPEYPLIARTLNHLGMAEFEMLSTSKALKYLVEALTIHQRRGEQGYDCAEVLCNTGLVFEAVRNRERALDAFIEAAKILKELGYSETHAMVMKVNSRIRQIETERRPLPFR